MSGWRPEKREEAQGVRRERGWRVFGAVFTAGTLAVAQTALTSACLCVCVLRERVHGIGSIEHLKFLSFAKIY